MMESSTLCIIYSSLICTQMHKDKDILSQKELETRSNITGKFDSDSNEIACIFYDCAVKK